MDPACFDGWDCPAHRIDIGDDQLRLCFEFVGQCFDEVRTCQWVGATRDTAFVGDDLLRAQRQRGCLFGRQPDRLVVTVGMQALSATEHRSQPLHGGADHVVEWLLSHQARPSRLRVEAQHQALFFLCAEPFFHDGRP